MKSNELGKEKEGKRSPKISFIEVIKNNISIREETNCMNYDRIKWRKIIYVADPN